MTGRDPEQPDRLPTQYLEARALAFAKATSSGPGKQYSYPLPKEAKKK